MVPVQNEMDTRRQSRTHSRLWAGRPVVVWKRRRRRPLACYMRLLLVALTRVGRVAPRRKQGGGENKLRKFGAHHEAGTNKQDYLNLLLM